MATAANAEFAFPPKQEFTTTIKPRNAGAKNISKHESAGKKYGMVAASVGLVAGVAGAIGLAAYLRAPEMDEETVDNALADGQPHTGGAAAGASQVAPVDEVVEDVTPAAPAYRAVSHIADTHVVPEPAPGSPTSVRSANVVSQHDGIEPLTDINDVHVATLVSDDMSFSQAFAAARAEVGAHGIFGWHGGVYHTYYADEWHALPTSYRAEFSSHDFSDNFEVVEVPNLAHIPEIQYDESGTPYVTFTDAITGELVNVPTTENDLIVLDSSGRYITTVHPDDLPESFNGNGQSLVIEPGGEVAIVDNDAELARFAAGLDVQPVDVIEIDESDGLSETDVFEILWDETEDFLLDDEDVTVIDLESDDVTVVDITDGEVPDVVIDDDAVPADDYTGNPSDDDTIELIDGSDADPMYFV